MKVEVKDGNIDKAIKDLKKRMAREGILKEIKKRRHYEKPSVRRRRKSAAAAKQRRKAEKKALVKI